jgi:hypothetical protein
MRKSRSHDWLTLARAALESALPTRDAVLQLLEDAPRAHAKPAPVEAAALA